jgi:hypothetical protein
MRRRRTTPDEVYTSEDTVGKVQTAACGSILSGCGVARSGAAHCLQQNRLKMRKSRTQPTSGQGLPLSEKWEPTDMRRVTTYLPPACGQGQALSLRNGQTGRCVILLESMSEARPRHSTQNLASSRRLRGVWYRNVSQQYQNFGTTHKICYLRQQKRTLEKPCIG